MANLSTLIEARSTAGSTPETNLAEGSIIWFTANTTDGTPYPCYAQWKAPSNGRVIVEVWGAAGSSSRVCCCGASMPGNAGAYSRRETPVSTNTCICFCVGMPCTSPSNQIECSEATMLCVSNNSAGDTFCMCAQGGAGGYGMCISGSSIACCFVSGQTLCNSLSSGCGWVCNTCSGRHNATAYGGTTNIQGGYSKQYFGHCNPCCVNCHYSLVKTSAGVFGTEPSEIRHSIDWCRQCCGGGDVMPMINAVTSASKQPQQGGHLQGSWFSTIYCGCYQSHMCQTMYGTGIPAPGAGMRDNGRAQGSKGGMGAVKINFIPNS